MLSMYQVASPESDFDKDTIFKETVEQGRCQFEAPMPAVKKITENKYKIFVDDKLVRSGVVERKPESLITNADYVDTRIGTAHSRWMIAPGHGCLSVW